MFNTKIFFPAVLITVLFLVSACKKNDERPALQVAAAYNDSNYATQASTQINVVTQLINITNEVKKGRVNGVVINKTTLDNLFNAGNPSLSSLIMPYYKSKLEGTNNWFDEIAKASGGTYTPSNNIQGQGGTFGGYLFDENGAEMEQMIEKGMFGAVLYKHATELLSGNITEETPHKLVAIFGGTPAFSNSGSNNITADKRDLAMANYASRRDKNDGKGFYTQFKNQILKLQSAIKAGNDYNQERNEAIAEIKLIWEKVNKATIINYCFAVMSTMSKTTTTDAEKASALHAYNECVGFLHGWRTIAQDQKRITDAQIDEILVLLNAPYNVVPTSYKFITDPANELPKLQQIINKLQQIYGFTTQDLEDFKKNWVAEQNR